MPTSQLNRVSLAAIVTAAFLTAVVYAGQQTTRPMTDPHNDMPMTGMPMHDGMVMTKADKITNAMSAAPSMVSAKATILDWPAREGAAPDTLRAGTSGWTCLPDMPQTKGNDPMCLDQAWMKWFEAYLAKKAPIVPRVGVGYMLAPGGGFGSNTDPFAMSETRDNQWGHHAPHLMIVVPDTKALTGISTDPANGGPYVMFAGTPYAHIMAPATAGMMH